MNSIINFYHRHRAIILISAVGLLIALFAFISYQLLGAQKIQQQLLDLLPQGKLGIAVLFIVLVLGTSIGLPRQVAAFCSGFTLDIVSGALFATAAAVGGCMITITLGRRCFSEQLAQRYPNQLGQLQRFFAERIMLKAIIIRLIPAGSNLLTNLLAGFSKVPVKPYILGSAVGFLPQMFLFSMLGNGIKINNQQQITVSIVLFIIAALLTAYLIKTNKTNSKSGSVN